MAVTDNSNNGEFFDFLDSKESVTHDVLNPASFDSYDSDVLETIVIQVNIGKDRAKDSDPMVFKNGEDMYVAIKNNLPKAEIEFVLTFWVNGAIDGFPEKCYVSSESSVSVCSKSGLYSIFFIRDLPAEDSIPEGPTIVNILAEKILHPRSGVIYQSSDSSFVVHSSICSKTTFKVEMKEVCYLSRVITDTSSAKCCNTVLEVKVGDESNNMQLKSLEGWLQEQQITKSTEKRHKGPITEVDSGYDSPSGSPNSKKRRECWPLDTTTVH